MQVVSEVPGSPVFMMQLCSEARHLEVSVMGLIKCAFDLHPVPPPLASFESVVFALLWTVCYTTHARPF